MVARSLGMCGVAAALALALAACGAGPDFAGDAAALEAQGRLPESAAKLEMVCAVSPGTDKCAKADPHTAELRLDAAEKAIADGHFIAAERLLYLTFLTADAASEKRGMERLAQPDLRDGLIYERALAAPDKRRTYDVLSKLVGEGSPVGDRAKPWLERERAAFIAEDAKAACRADGKGSCSQAAAALRALPTEVPDAIAVIDAEERRIYPLRVQAERLLQVYATRGLQKQAFQKCIDAPREERMAARTHRVNCLNEVYKLDDYDQRKADDDTFRRLLKSIRDPKLAQPLEERKKQALADGQISILDIPKPPGGDMIDLDSAAPPVEAKKPDPPKPVAPVRRPSPPRRGPRKR